MFNKKYKMPFRMPLEDSKIDKNVEKSPRQLGFPMIFAGSDFSAFKKINNQKDYESTLANCRTESLIKLA